MIRSAFTALALVLMAFAGCARERVERVEWPVMGTVAAVQFKGAVDAGTVETVKAVFAEADDLLTRFNTESELNRLASLPDREVLAQCDAKMRPCYETAFRLRDETGGLFNPRWRGPGTLDLGAIAKGFAVDLAVEAVRPRVRDGKLLVDLGGNLRAVAGSWSTGVTDPTAVHSVDGTAPADADVSSTFALAPDAACATSAEYFRGKHIRNGRTGEEVATHVESVTVIHPRSAMLADGLSTVMFLLGREKGEAFLKAHYPEARAIWIVD